MKLVQFIVDVPTSTNPHNQNSSPSGQPHAMSTNLETLQVGLSAPRTRTFLPRPVWENIHCKPRSHNSRRPAPRFKFQGRRIIFANESVWKIQEPLSEVALQQVDGPCKARQVFTVVCVKDPLCNYREQREAVAKIKIQ
jgi:hypothetical protein